MWAGNAVTEALLFIGLLHVLMDSHGSLPFSIVAKLSAKIDKTFAYGVAALVLLH